MKPIFKDDKIYLRALEPTDLDDLYKWENDTTLWDVGNSISPYSRHQLWEYLQNYDGDIYKSHQLRLMIVETESDRNIGTLDFYDFDPFNNRGAIGILISSEFQNKGYGKRALSLTLQYATEYLGLHQCVAIIPHDNVKSIKLFQSVGFEITGRFKDWLRIGKEYKEAFMLQFIANSGSVE